MFAPVLSLLLLTAGDPPATLPLRLERVESTNHTYTGVTLEITSPWGQKYLMWPEETWNWQQPNGQHRMVFSRAEHIQGFEADATGTRVTYEHTGGPEGSQVHVEVVAGPDTVTVRHRIQNDSDTVIIGGSPCLQDRDRDRIEAWGFEAAKRVFLWTEEGGFGWSSDVRRTGGSDHALRRPFCAAFLLRPRMTRSIFGRSPDLCSSPLVGYLTPDREHLVAVLSDHPKELILGFYNCIHSRTSVQVKPGDALTTTYRMYFCPANVPRLVERARADFPVLDLPAVDESRLVLGGGSTPRMSFERPEDFERLRRTGVRTEATTQQHLSVEGPGARTFGRTDGREAALCTFEDDGVLEVPDLFPRGAGRQFFSVDLTLPVDEAATYEVAVGREDRWQRLLFELFPGAPRRCVVPLDQGEVEFAEGELLTVTLARREGAHLLQVDTLCVHPSP